MSVPFPPSLVAASEGLLVDVRVAADGSPVAATAALRVHAPIDRVWAVISDVASYGGRVPMIQHVGRTADRVRVKLRFRMSLISVGFEFAADATYEDERWLELRWVDGEPRDLRIRFDLAPDGDGTLVHAFVGFDINSLGFVVKLFLKHHPEIRFGVYSGAALVLLDAMRRAAEAPR